MLTDPDVIRVLLGRLAAARAPAFALVDGVDERFATTLLEHDRVLHALIADELHLSRGHALVRTGSRLRIACKLDGVEVRFATVVRAIDDEGAVAAYLLAMPDALDYREHRGLKRLRARDLGATLDNGDAHAAARVVDISIGGLRLAIAAPHPLGADQVWNCRVALPNGNVDASIAVVRVRGARARPSFGEAREDDIGARFGTLSAPAARRLGRFLADAERTRLRAQSTHAQGFR
jgi:c-di-GMP-binding flagellar brake protein YcgR